MLDIAALRGSFMVEPGILHHLLATLTRFCERPLYVKSH